MKKEIALLALACAGSICGQASAAEGTVLWYDPTCRYFVMQLPEGSEGFGLYQWKGGLEPKEGTVIVGDILGGPELTVNDKASNQEMAVVHWGDAKKSDLLIRYAPGYCKNKRKRN